MQFVDHLREHRLKPAEGRREIFKNGGPVAGLTRKADMVGTNQNIVLYGAIKELNSNRGKLLYLDTTPVQI